MFRRGRLRCGTLSASDVVQRNGGPHLQFGAFARCSLGHYAPVDPRSLNDRQSGANDVTAELSGVSDLHLARRGHITVDPALDEDALGENKPIDMRVAANGHRVIRHLNRAVE